MADRRAFASSRTDCANPDPSLPTVAEILELDVIRRGVPDVVAGIDHLDRRVRWVHVADSSAVSALLEGQELLLSTGTAWPAEPGALERHLSALLDSGIAGLVLELGHRQERVPDTAVRLFAERRVPLVALAREIPFVRVTSEVHRRIIEGQTNALRARDAVRELFTGLSLRGSPVDFVVGELARELGSGVVLEDLDHRVIVAAGVPETGVPLEGWQTASRELLRTARWGEGATARTAEGWQITAVEARGMRWGRLIGLPGPEHPAGSAAVMEQAAVALAIDRLTDDSSDRWVRRSHRQLLDTLLGGRFRSPAGIGQAFEAAGFPVRERTLLGVAVRVDGGARGAGSERIADAVPVVRQALEELGATAVVAVPETGHGESGPELVAAVSIASDGGPSEAWITKLGRILDSRLERSDAGAQLVVGRAAGSIEGLLDSLLEVRTSGRTSKVARIGRLTISRPSERPLEQLLVQLRSDTRVQEYVSVVLQPIIDHEAESGGDLFAVLGAYLAHPGNRSRAAQSSLLSRSVFYQRLALIEELLGVDLADGATITALHTALIAYRIAPAE